MAHTKGAESGSEMRSALKLKCSRYQDALKAADNKHYKMSDHAHKATADMSGVRDTKVTKFFCEALLTPSKVPQRLGRRSCNSTLRALCNHLANSWRTAVPSTVNQH